MKQPIPRYNPMVAPTPAHWLALDEQQRIDLVRAYHRRIGRLAPGETAHAMIHVVVENQIADDALPVRRTAQRLQAEGLDRHQAVHAIASVLAEHIHNMLSEAGAGSRPDESNFVANANKAYFSALERLTAEGWLRSA